MQSSCGIRRLSLRMRGAPVWIARLWIIAVFADAGIVDDLDYNKCCALGERHASTGRSNCDNEGPVDVQQPCLEIARVCCRRSIQGTNSPTLANSHNDSHGTPSRSARSANDNELIRNVSCPAGYRYNLDTRICDDIDECDRTEGSSNGKPGSTVNRQEEDFGRESTTACPQGTKCHNTIGSFHCFRIVEYPRCAEGFRWDEGENACLDIDECTEMSHSCAHDGSEICRNLEGSHVCELQCRAGYSFDENTGLCVDINECVQLSHACFAPEICANTQGNFLCINPLDRLDGLAGFGGPNYLDGDADEEEEAVDDVSLGTERKSMEDIDECALDPHPCSSHELCRNTLAGYDCIPTGCPKGFVLVHGRCEDFDECLAELHSCNPHERCQNTNGSFTCEEPRPSPRAPSSSTGKPANCSRGFRATEQGDCIDIDECLEGPGCRDFESCSNSQGAYSCSPLCGPGWYFDIQTRNCHDVDECLLGHHDCRQRSHYCRNTAGSFVCEPLRPCSPGYRRSSGGNCVDVDECLEGLHSCSRADHRYCVNLDGGYKCVTRLPECPRGLEYSVVKMRCEDVDECAIGTAECGANERCVNLEGKYRCERAAVGLEVTRFRNRARPACPTGLSYDPAKHVDECAENLADCRDSDRCYNQPGGYQCANSPRPSLIGRRSPEQASAPCPPGFRLDSSTGNCQDVDECLDRSICSSHEECVNGPGGYACRCLIGFRRDNFTGACIDLNECQLDNDCLPTQRCDNTIGSYACVRFLPCGTGYTLNAATDICEDDDECALGTHDCGKGYHCRNTVGSYRCNKDKPLRNRYGNATVAATTTMLRPSQRPSTGPHYWSSPSPTSPHAPTTTSPITSRSWLAISSTTPRTANTTRASITETIPTVGSLATTQRPLFTTPKRREPTRPIIPSCPRGFDPGPSPGQCVDIDECQRDPLICGRRELFDCFNTLGSYLCQRRAVGCAAGYRYDERIGACSDVDECSDGAHRCARDQACENRPGGYACVCPVGYSIAPDKSCVDVDECLQNPMFVCGPHGRCENSPGSYRCVCKPGYENAGPLIGCRDVDECRSNVGVCQHECLNTWGSFRCGCRAGYRLRKDNRTCEDVNECLEFPANNLCIGFCDNTPGSYKCRCPSGYTLAEDGRTCKDIDECERGNPCAPAESCDNTHGGFRCNRLNCPPGYIKDPNRKNRCKLENPFCSAGDRACLQRPAHFTYNYIAIVSNFPIPVSSGEVKLFTMVGTHNVPGSTVRFRMALIGTSAPPHVVPATESSFGLRRPQPSQAILVLTRSLQGPQDVELEFAMEIYYENGDFAGSAVAKIYIIVTQYEF